MRNLARLFLFIILIGGGQIAISQIPQTISYQGELTDVSGDPVADGIFTLNFRLYDVAVNGEPLCEETHEVQVANGIFNVVLGRTNTVDLPFDSPYFLGISIGEDSELREEIERIKTNRK